MRFCSSFDHAGHGAFSLHTPSFRFLFVSSPPHRRICFSRGPLKLRPAIASDNRASFIISAAQSPSPLSADSSSDKDLTGKGKPERQQVSASSKASSREGRASAFGSSSSPSSSGSSASVECTSESSSGNQASVSSSSSSSPSSSSSSSSPSSSDSSWTPVAQVQSSSCKIAGSAFPSMDSSLPRFKNLSHMSRGIKTAFDVLQGWKVIQKLQDSETIFVSGGWIFLSVKAAKFFAKGLKMSQRVLASSPLIKLVLERHPNRATLERLVHNDLASAARGFNAFYAAIKIVQFSSSIGKQSQEEGSLPDFGFLWKGFSFSKSLVSLLDAVVGKNGWAVACMGKGFFIAKTAIGGISVMVKAAFLSKELGPAILKRLAVCSGTLAAILGASRQTSDPKSLTLVMLQQRKLKGFSSLTLFKDRYIGRDLAMLATEEHFCKDEGLYSLCSLVCSMADNSFLEQSKEGDLMSVFCLAIPLQVNQGPVFA